MSHPASLDIRALLDQCDVRFTRRSGPGGQNRNKVETAAVLTHRPTGITAEANERRSQAQNREQALFRLRVKLALEIRVGRDLATIPSPLWRSRAKSGRIAVNPHHEDYPALLAEALDVIARCEGDLREAGECLGVSSSQIVKLLKGEPRALAMVNADRQARGLNVLL